MRSDTDGKVYVHFKGPLEKINKAILNPPSFKGEKFTFYNTEKEALKHLPKGGDTYTIEFNLNLFRKGDVSGGVAPDGSNLNAFAYTRCLNSDVYLREQRD